MTVVNPMVEHIDCQRDCRSETGIETRSVEDLMRQRFPTIHHHAGCRGQNRAKTVHGAKTLGVFRWEPDARYSEHQW